MCLGSPIAGVAPTASGLQSTNVAFEIGGGRVGVLEIGQPIEDVYDSIGKERIQLAAAFRVEALPRWSRGLINKCWNAELFEIALEGQKEARTPGFVRPTLTPSRLFRIFQRIAAHVEAFTSSSSC